MVHIPVFGIDVPEPRVALLLPDVVSVGVKLCSRAMDKATDLLYPLNPEQEQAVMDEFIEHMPREFDRVLQRCWDGKIKNDEQLSSECEEASFDWYRRAIRTAVIGETEEDQEDVAAYKLGLEVPSALETVRLAYEIEHADTMFNPDVAGVLAGSTIELNDEGEAAEEVPPEAAAARAAAAAALEVAGRHRQECMRRAAEARRRLQELEAGARSGARRTAVATVNAGAGLALSLLLAKGLALGVRRILARRPKAPRKKQGLSSRSSSMQAPPPQQQTQAQQQQAQQQQATAAAARRARASTRKR